MVKNAVEKIEDDAWMVGGSTREAVLLPIKKMGKDLRYAAKTIGSAEARFLVDSYYTMQANRIRSSAQVRELAKTGEPHEVLDFFEVQNEALESQIKGALEVYTNNHPIGQWLRSVDGIGPVIAAGILANFDITKAATAGAFWDYAGLNPAVNWIGKDGAEELADEVMGKEKIVTDKHMFEFAQKTSRKSENLLRMVHVFRKDEKNQKPVTRAEIVKVLSMRPYNDKIKTLLWKAGESFVKVSNKDGALYGKLYKEKKLSENQKNDELKFADQAKAKLKKNKIGKDTDAYSYYIKGMLPPAHIHARAKRYAVKIFVSHLFDVMYRAHYNAAPPKPFALAILHHAHMIEPND